MPRHVTGGNHRITIWCFCILATFLQTAPFLIDIAIDFDAAVIGEPDQAVPLVQSVLDGVANRRRLGDALEAILEPGFQVLDFGSGSRLTDGASLLRWPPADLFLDLVQFLNALQGVLSNGRRTIGGDFVKSSAQVSPAIGERHRSAAAIGTDKDVVAVIAVHLQNAAEAFQQRLHMFAAAPRRIEIDHGGRRLAAPRPVIAGQSPEVAGLGLAAPRI